MLMRHTLAAHSPPPIRSTRSARRHTRVTLRPQGSRFPAPAERRVKRRPMKEESIQDWSEKVGAMPDGTPRLGHPGAKVWGTAPGGGVVKEEEVRRLALGYWSPDVFDS